MLQVDKEQRTSARIGYNLVTIVEDQGFPKLIIASGGQSVRFVGGDFRRFIEFLKEHHPLYPKGDY